MIHEECHAVKVWEWEKNDNHVTVYHNGDHICPSVEKRQVSQYLDLIRKNPNIKPNALVNSQIVRQLQKDNIDFDAVDKLAKKFASKKLLYKAIEKVKEENEPYGTSFAAVTELRNKVKTEDPYYIYNINNKDMNESTSSYIFQSSKHMADIALLINSESETSILRNEYVYVDGTHHQSKNFITITLWVYHTGIRQMICLALMICERENTESLNIFWNLFQKMLKEVSGINTYAFNPKGFICDENAANFKAIEQCFGQEGLEKTKTCEFHYLQSVHRHSRMVANSDLLIKLGNEVLKALTITSFLDSQKKLESFVANNPVLIHWLNWWMDRKRHVFRAFKDCDTPSSNLAEVGHSMLRSVSKKNKSLLDDVSSNIAFAIAQKASFTAYRDGSSTGGRGIENKARDRKIMSREIKRAKTLAKEIIDETVVIENVSEVFVPDSGAHRPRKRKNAGCETNIAKKPKTIGIPEMDYKPFSLIFHQDIKNVISCYGCKLKFADKYKKEPHNLILRRFARRRYYDGKDIKISTRLSGTYYHLRETCMRKEVVDAGISDVKLYDEIKDRLSKEHKDQLKKIGIIL
jgi:hypothetical protein